MYRVITPAVTNDLTVLATVKEELGIPADDTSRDARLLRLIAEASDMVTQRCNRDGFGRKMVEETFLWGPGIRGVMLSGDLDPVLEQIVVGGVPVNVAEYVLDGPLLTRAGHPVSWTSHSGIAGQQMVVTYWTGWNLLAQSPPSLERACIDLVTAIYSRPASRDPTIRGEIVEGVGSVTYGAAPAATRLSNEEYPVLERFRRFAL
jgi:hypothetical protein